MFFLYKTQFYLNYFKNMMANICKTPASKCVLAGKFCTGYCSQQGLLVNNNYLLEPAPLPPKKIITPSRNPKSYHPPELGKAYIE